MATIFNLDLMYGAILIWAQKKLLLVLSGLCYIHCYVTLLRFKKNKQFKTKIATQFEIVEV